jgi:hypothetical protein
MSFSPAEQLETLNLDFSVFNKYTENEVITLLNTNGFINSRIETQLIGEEISFAVIGEKRE